MKSATSSFVFIWFGAAVSLAEILAGTFFAPLGFEKGLLAIVIGHAIGGLIFLLVAYISAKTARGAMDTVKISFGRFGSLIFSISNIVQLVGWTSIMIFSGAAAAQVLAPELGYVFWCIVLGVLIVVWVALNVKGMIRAQTVAALLLFVLCFVLSFLVFGQIEGSTMPEGAISFGAAVELAVAMPLSWLPVVGDYTKNAKNPKAASAVSAFAYTFGSIWMFALGLAAALFTGSSEIATILARAGLGVVGIVIIIFSTVTTTFLDAASAGFSAQSIYQKVDAKLVGIGAAIVGTLLAIFAPVARFEEFLYLIGSIFAPMVAVLIVDCLVFKKNKNQKSVDVVSVVLWLFGFALYRVSMSWDFVLGNTLPVVILVAITTYVVRKSIQTVCTKKKRANEMKA